ncbi:MAG: D-alanine--D-alanine ligase [bacterium]|nr:D-alanine--D-alanine ligase [bacterium]
MKSRIAVVFGGRSGEHDVSIRSAKAVIENIDRSKYSVIPIAIDRAGHWLDPRVSAGLLPSETSQLVASDVAEMSEDAIALIGDPKYHGMVELKDHSPLGIDVVFPVLHGTYGEDGTLQGLFEMADVPYIGCGVLASSCGMDKVVMKSLFKEAGLPICRYDWFLRRQWESDEDAILDRIEKSVGFPCFVKPANLGSSVGISRAETRQELRQGIAVAAEYDRRIIVEEGLKMREIECAILGNDEPIASQPGEYLIRDNNKAFLDYTEKYSGTGNNEFVVPAPVSAELAAKIQDLAIRAFKSIDGAGLARVDFFLRTDNGALLVNEINTLPGLTDASGYPKMWAGSGKPFVDVIDELIALAWERHADRKFNKTSMV